MPYISQECMKDFIESLKEDYHFSHGNVQKITGMMEYFFGYKGE